MRPTIIPRGDLTVNEIIAKHGSVPSHMYTSHGANCTYILFSDDIAMRIESRGSNPKIYYWPVDRAAFLGYNRKLRNSPYRGIFAQ